ncbi:MAG: DUF362 domain-containing protein [Acidobacteria bacterium]|jgi:uncharacterized protein (DUF362 family)/NAD-dependent dihydropyrimidine dehydrogenase PreA subunit|nr:DUF362 domain-containing protein [Acidobacteriota bacterium]
MAGRHPDPAAKSAVALVACPDYDETRVLAALRRGVDLLGGIQGFAGSGDRLLLKPNILVGALPQKHVTTHPAVLRAMGLLLQETGARVRFGDSPGFGNAIAAAARAGLAEVAAAIGMEQADLATPGQVSFNEALIAKQLVLSRAALEADGIISLAKMKTHGFMRITGAVKNQFGCVPGIRKGEYHVKMPRAEHFAAMLVDINRYLRSRLYVLDGIVAMEGNGPGSGTPRRMNVLLLSSDPVALDAVFCRLVHLPVAFVPTMKPGAESGLGTWNDDEIEVRGDEISALACPDFKVVRRPAVEFDRSFPYYLKKWITPRPFIDPALCRQCGVCTEVCPLEPKAVRPLPGRPGTTPAYDYARCIRCYCCQEMCPHGAIAIRRPLLSRLIHR